MNRNIQAITALLTASLVTACSVPLPERIDFAISEKRVCIPAEGGDANVTVYSNDKVSIFPDKIVDWGRVTTPASFRKDGEVNVHFEKNDGLRRSVNVVVSYMDGLAKDTVRFQQEGLQAKFVAEEHVVKVDSRSTGTIEVPAEINIEAQDVGIEVSYVGDNDGWVESVEIFNDKITFRTKSLSSESVQRATARFSHVDGWGERILESVNLILSDKDGNFGKLVDYRTVRENAGTEATSIKEDWIIEGIVISDCTSKNMEFNPNVAYNKVDTSPSDKTAYMENADGSLGFKIVFSDAKDNTLSQGQRIRLYLNGLSVVKESDPDRYTISGATPGNIESSGSVTTVPPKEKKISQLTDEDVYTFVELTGTEFLNKDGSYTNVYDSFTLPSDFNTTKVTNKMNADCWPIMLIDDEGSPMLALVNMLCPWRRNGTGVPQGTGKLKGILVHNVQPRYGDMGRYQIRVVDAKGFAQQKSAASGFSILAEWDGRPYAYNFSNYGSFFPYSTSNNGMDSVLPSDDFDPATGEHRAVLFFENKLGMPTGTTKAIRPCQSFDALKMGTNGGRISNRTMSLQVDLGGWYNWNDDGSIESYNGIVTEFSTAGLEGRKLFLYYAFCSGGSELVTFRNFPGRWCVEYSIDGGRSYKIVRSSESGKEYVHLRSYPNGGPMSIDGREYYPSYSMGLGHTEHLYEFPPEILGKESVRVRLRPYDTTLTSLPEDPAADIECIKAHKGISLYQDLRINRIYFLTK